eukprot:TRINITY_DN6523_c0_g2_i1.p1 TRINITY_DN6523_c0_g2~~TRINITY_DN6523_c0_g2_i1.p1  ORF type:complete len:321 (-),score=53.33 TRINITY_DN6523_c0_g2_i1:7-969(-)
MQGANQQLKELLLPVTTTTPATTTTHTPMMTTKETPRPSARPGYLMHSESRGALWWKKMRRWRGPIPLLLTSKRFQKIMLIIVICCELYTATIEVLLAQQEKEANDVLWVVYIVTGWVRIVTFLFVCMVLDPIRFLWQLVKLDSVMVTGFGSLLAYSLFVASIEPGGTRVTAAVTYSLLIMTLSAEVRLMVKYFPWNKWSIWFYKLTRGYHVVFFLAVELSVQSQNAVIKSRGDVPDDPSYGLQLTFFTTTLTYAINMFAIVLAKEVALHKIERDARAMTDESRDPFCDWIEKCIKHACCCCDCCYDDGRDDNEDDTLIF